MTSLVQENLINREGYAPYCGSECSTMPRAKFDGKQFVCPNCGWKSEFPADFIKKYKDKWHKAN